MIQGIILKGYSGFYYVLAEDRVWECSLRGRFRIRDQEFLPGDRVLIMPGKGEKASIEKVEERYNSLLRPSIANVDQALLVFSLTSPQPDLNFLDRLLIQVIHSDIKPILVLTKLDIWSKEQDKDERILLYEKLGYVVFNVSSKTGEGIDGLKPYLTGKTSVLAGPSGVGKSSLVNALEPGFELKTGEVSRKLARGRHTTRHVELLTCAGGLLADTPGFSSLYLPQIKREELSFYFPEFESYLGKCRFKTCLHNEEPDCAVKEALNKGELFPSRFEHYQIFLQEVIANERRY